ncbi:X-box-binding protein 1 [Trachymyrmex septentrionalis]|uniref:X-box-binding protein 1 n=1 Tax=Trachymyrmex septentrionalis TaxID=34720 RepID=A0A195FEF8_9HYME|nr:X-box-binding protein 1 [Trachymyrmex septentrionalis]
MSSVKSVIITLPKRVSKAIPRTESSRNSLPKLNFMSVLVDKARMDSRKVVSDQQKETRDDDVATLLEPVDTRVRGKKRRLDHLTWEEKLQRKKLKNRVAAQTSRDRKKARLDELEETVRTQKERSELLTQECAMLRSQNELLTSQKEWLLNENKRLRNERDAVRNTLTDQQQPICSACRTRVDSAVPSLGSAVSPNDPLPQGGTAQSALRLTRTPEATALLKFLTLYFLWKNFSPEVEANPPRSNEQVSVNETPVEKPDHPEALVGQTSKNVEASRTGGSIDSVSSYLRDTSNWFLEDCDTTKITSIKTETEIKQESETASDLDTVYGTYDETTNSITIMYPGEENDGCVGIQECVQEVVSSNESGAVSHAADDAVNLTVPSLGIQLRYSTQFSPAYINSMSPAMSDVDSYGISPTKQLDCASLSDGGYESHDSPQSHMSELFDLESFSELFPALLAIPDKACCRGERQIDVESLHM